MTMRYIFFILLISLSFSSYLNVKLFATNNQTLVLSNTNIYYITLENNQIKRLGICTPDFLSKSYSCIIPYYASPTSRTFIFYSDKDISKIYEEVLHGSSPSNKLISLDDYAPGDYVFLIKPPSTSIQQKPLFEMPTIYIGRPNSIIGTSAIFIYFISIILFFVFRAQSKTEQVEEDDFE